MTIQNQINNFLHYLEIERGFSPRTINAYKHDLSKFLSFLESLNRAVVSDVSKNDIRSFLANLAKGESSKPNKEITRARKLSSIKSFFKYLNREEILEVNPAGSIETPKIPQREPNYLTNDEFESLIQTVRQESTPYYNARDLAIVITLLGTGVRLSELVNLNLNSLDFENGLMRVIGKGNKERIIPLNNDVKGSLEKYLKNRPRISGNALFVSRLGNRLSAGSVYHLIKIYLKKAGIRKEKLGVHSLRHTFGASLLSKNVNLVVIQELLGHCKLETTRRYLHINSVDLRNAVEQLSLK